MASSVTRRNPNVLTATRRKALELGKYRVRVGWAVDMGADPKTVEIATYNTLGAPAANIPARDPLTPTLAAQLERIRQANVEAVRASNRGDDPEPELEALAADLEYAFKRAIEELRSPPNAPSTVEGKGFDDPLVGAGADGGRLVAEAAAKVTKR